MISDLIEINLFQIDTADGTVVHGPVIDHLVFHIRGRGPLGRAWNIGRNLACRKLDTDWDIEVIQDLERLTNGLFCGIALWSGRLIESGTDKTRGRCHVARDAQKTTTGSE